MQRLMSALAASAVAAMIALPAPALAQARAKVGTLACDVTAGIGLIVTSKKGVACMFTPAQSGPREVYNGSITKFGLDLGATSGGEMIWVVLAPSNRRFGALAGKYGGANGLVGGSHRTVTLQPLSVQGQTGVNLAVGVAGLELHPAR